MVTNPIDQSQAKVAERDIVVWWDEDSAQWCARAEGVSTLLALGSGDSDLEAASCLFDELRGLVEHRHWHLDQGKPERPFDRAAELVAREDDLMSALFPRQPDGESKVTVGPPTLDEALRRMGIWGDIIRGAIEREEVIPRELFTVSFRRLTASEMEYGRALAGEFFDEDGGLKKEMFAAEQEGSAPRDALTLKPGERVVIPVEFVGVEPRFSWDKGEEEE